VSALEGTSVISNECLEKAVLVAIEHKTGAAEVRGGIACVLRFQTPAVGPMQKEILPPRIAR
jgi:hypothetical protein